MDNYTPPFPDVIITFLRLNLNKKGHMYLIYPASFDIFFSSTTNQQKAISLNGCDNSTMYDSFGLLVFLDSSTKEYVVEERYFVRTQFNSDEFFIF